MINDAGSSFLPIRHHWMRSKRNKPSRIKPQTRYNVYGPLYDLCGFRFWQSLSARKVSSSICESWAHWHSALWEGTWGRVCTHPDVSMKRWKSLGWTEKYMGQPPGARRSSRGKCSLPVQKASLILTAVFPRSALDGGHVWGLRSQQQSSASQTREKDHPRWEVAENHQEMMELGMTKFNC